MTDAAARLAAEKAKPVDKANYADDEDAWKKEIKLKFDIHDVRYWFNAVEASMKKFGINLQWSKKDAILPLLPEDVIEECKPILRLTQDEAGSQIYHDLKKEILSLYGPRDEDAFQKAIALRLTSTPSALGKKLIHIICPGAKPFDGCHCAKMVYGFWWAQLSLPIRSHLARKPFNKDTYADLFKDADEVWRANGGNTTPVPAVVGAVAANPPAPVVSQPADQVSAVRGGRGGFSNRGNRGGRGGRGAGRGSSSTASNTNNSQNQSNNTSSTSNKPHQKGPKASPDVPSNACSQHWKAGRAATYCSDPFVCSWAKILVPRQPKN